MGRAGREREREFKRERDILKERKQESQSENENKKVRLRKREEIPAKKCVCVLVGNATLNNLDFHWLAFVHKMLILLGADLYKTLGIKGHTEISNLFCCIR